MARIGHNQGMDAKKIKNRLKGETDRKRVSLYLSESILADFNKASAPVSVSKVLEQLMKDFIESNKKTRKP